MSSSECSTRNYKKPQPPTETQQLTPLTRNHGNHHTTTTKRNLREVPTYRESIYFKPRPTRQDPQPLGILFRNRSQANCTNRTIPICPDPIACAQGLWFSYDTAPGVYGAHTPITSRERKRPDLYSVNAYLISNLLFLISALICANSC